jgi:hypothetical protein
MGEKMQRPRGIEGRVRIELRDAAGVLVTDRRVRNAVVRSGAELVAALFRGSVATPVNGVGVGVDPTPPAPPYEATALTVAAPDGTPILQQGASPIVPADVQTEVLADQLKVRVTLRSVIGPNRAVSADPDVQSVQIGEAALGVLAADGNSLATVYNRVVFEPVPKRRDQERAFYWEIDFPYGV